MNRFFDKVKKTFGFGCMRLPIKDGEVDYDELKKWWTSLLETVSTILIRRTAMSEE